MIEHGLLFVIERLPLLGQLHAAGPTTPVPHWVVLLVVVPALGLVISGAVLVIDRLLQKFGI